MTIAMCETSTSLAPDKASDVLRSGRHPLDPFFRPHSVAVIGATEKKGSVGRTVLQNLISSPFGGTVLPVNPKRDNVLGIRAYPDLAAIDGPVDLAVVVTPAPSVPDVIAECAVKGVKGVIVISAGFREIGPEGEELERRILAQGRQGAHPGLGPHPPG